MDKKQADGFSQLEEQCRELATRASWVLQALPRPRNGDVEMEETLRKTCQYVESALTELRGAVHHVRELEAALLVVQATAAERDEAAARAAARAAEADEKAADADKRASGALASIQMYDEMSRGLEEDRSQVKDSIERWSSMLEVVTSDAKELARQKSELVVNRKEVDDMIKAAESAGKQRAEAEEEVIRLQKRSKAIQESLAGEWDCLMGQRKTLSEEVDLYNKSVVKLGEWKVNASKELHEEKERVGRRDQMIAGLRKTISENQQSILMLKSECSTETSKVMERDRVIAEMGRDQEKKRADELQTQLSGASAKAEALQDISASEYRTLLQKLEDMEVSHDETLTSFQKETKAVTDAMASATEVMAEGTAANRDLKKDLSPNVRQLGVTSKELQKIEVAWAARQREDAARVSKDKVELVHELESRLRREHDDGLAELRAEHDEELARVCRQHADEADHAQDAVTLAQAEARELRMAVKDLQKRLDDSAGMPVSPERRHKKPKADALQPHLGTPPPSASRADAAVGTDTAKWQAVLKSAGDFWGSFEPRLIDRTGEPNYELLMCQLGKAVRDAATRARFVNFVNSDAIGWHCVDQVAEHGYEGSVSPQDERCTLKRHKKAGECLRMQRAGGVRIDFQYMKNR